MTLPLFILLLAVSWMLTGLIWLVQCTHYPAFRYVSEDRFRAFHRHHTQTITWIVLPLMTLEMILTILSVWQQPTSLLWWPALLLVLIIWSSTFVLQVPLHNKLANGRSERIIHKLVRSNWIRTIAWSLKSVYLSLLPFLFPQMHFTGTIG